jgi:acyl dehydratase
MDSADDGGRQFAPSAPYLVRAEDVARFADALGDPDPAYRGATAIAPPTFAAVIAARAWQPLFAPGGYGLSLSRTIHADQAFELARPLRVGDLVTGRLRVERVRRRGTSSWLSPRVDIGTVAGEPVCVCRATMVHNDGPAVEAETSPGRTDAVTDDRLARIEHVAPVTAGVAPVTAGVPPVTDWSPGLLLGEFDIAVTRRRLRDYALASGDDNPIHRDDAAARALGLPGVIAHGMLTLGLALRAVTSGCGDPARVASVRTRFTRPLAVPPQGTVLRVAARVRDVAPGRAVVAVDASDRSGSAPVGVLGGTSVTVRTDDTAAAEVAR